MYERRVSLDQAEISEGTLSLLLRNVGFMDEAIYKCSAITTYGRLERTIKPIRQGITWRSHRVVEGGIWQNSSRVGAERVGG